MPGHIAKTEGPDPSPDQWLYVSDELKVIILSEFKLKIIYQINLPYFLIQFSQKLTSKSL
jgi:hypothetical protein